MEISEKRGGGKKTVIKTAKCNMQGIYTIFELGHTKVPYGVRTQGHAEGYQPEEKALRLLQRKFTPHAQGFNTKPDWLVGRRG